MNIKEARSTHDDRVNVFFTMLREIIESRDFGTFTFYKEDEDGNVELLGKRDFVFNSILNEISILCQAFNVDYCIATKIVNGGVRPYLIIYPLD